MKSASLPLLLVLLFCGCLGARTARTDDAWHVVATDDWVTISVERALYRKPDNHRDFFMHVAIFNRTNRRIAAELSDSSRTIRPNHWGVFDQMARAFGSERRFGLPPPGAELKDRFKAACRAESIPLAAPQGRLDYYISAGESKEVEEMKGKYFLALVDGELLFTDGQTLHTLKLFTEESLKDDYRDPMKREVWIPMPIQWKTVPNKAIVVSQ